MSTPAKIICFCNRVSQDLVESCIQQGARTLAEIYDRCGAGTGPCGGSCRNSIQELIHRSEGKATQAIAGGSPSAAEAPPALVEGISLFNRRYYWECHEILEGIWMDEYGPPRLFYQGIIQASAALYHVLNANPKGVIRLAQEAQKKLSAYLPSYYGIELKPLLESLATFVAESQEILGQTRSSFSYNRLPQLRLGEEMNSPIPSR